jgi:hypothetical protein
MAINTEMKSLFIGSALVWTLLALTCSPESKKSGAVYGDPATSSPAQPESVQTGPSATIIPGGPAITNVPGNNTSTANTNTFTPDKDVCAGANAQAVRIKPRVMFVVDRSGSTADPYPGSITKWQAMYDALMAPNVGVISKLQSVAHFGMVLFDGGDLPGGMGIATGIMGGIGCIMDPASCPTDNTTIAIDAGTGLCPRLIVVDPALNNYDKINNAYLPSGPGGTTPTALALQAAYSLLPDSAQVLDQVIGDQFVVLCTDGLPNTCLDTANMNPAAMNPATFNLVEDKQGPIDQVAAAAARGIKTYVVGVAAVNDVAGDGGATAGGDAQTYLDELANHGGTGKIAFSPLTKDDLVNAITDIIGATVGCSVQLNGKVVVGKECSGTVYLNSKPLECKGPDGFKLVSESEIELQGAACDQFKKDPLALVSAKFPCESFVLE